MDREQQQGSSSKGAAASSKHRWKQKSIMTVIDSNTYAYVNQLKPKTKKK